MTEASPRYFALEIKEVAKKLETNPDLGLTNQEARRRLKQYGKNLLEAKKGKSPWVVFLEQFVNPIILVLVVATLLAFAFGEMLEGIAIVIVILVNSVIGFLMEWQAMVSMRKLQSLSRAIAKVDRDKQRIEIDSSELVPGDILYLEAGDMVTADARLIRQNNLAIQESALTGESVQVEKQTKSLAEDTILAERFNMVYKGTVVTRGNGGAIVTATGGKTELGKISTMANQAEKEATPLDKRLTALSKKLIWLTLALAALVLPLGMLQHRDWLIVIETAVALAVAAIPEGLPVIATISLARGMLRLSRKNVIVKSLAAVQTLGETNVIFTDKTGTLTENKMHANILAINGKQFKVEETTKQQFDQYPDLPLLLKIGALCNDGTFNESEAENNSGDPIEIALLRVAYDFALDQEKWTSAYPRIAEIPFDASIQMMGTLHEDKNGYLVCAKGATNAVLEKCNAIQMLGEIKDLQDKKRWLQLEDQLASQGLRVLSFAYQQHQREPDHERFLEGLIFLGLIGFIDPVRSDVKAAIRTCRQAGIEVLMVTGDHPETAANIALQAGILTDDEQIYALHGKDLKSLEALSKAQQERILKMRIFSRVSPEQKLDLVTIFQDHNYIVSMTGDGINDAPALKKANIGIAMGKRGTEAAKEVADMVLKDDAFSSIVMAIQQGRVIFENIRKFVVYLLSCNLSEILVVVLASLLNMPSPLLPLQILFLNLVTDVFPALAIGLDEGEQNIMKKPPRDPKEPIVTRALWISTFVYGSSITLGVVGAEYYSLHVLQLSGEMINNITFYTLVLAQLWNAFNLPEADISFFRNEITRNPYIWYAIALCIGIVGVAYAIPPVKDALNLVSFSFQNLLEVLIFSLLPVILAQLLKRVFKIVA